RCVNSVLGGLIGPKCLVYLDDILVFGEDEGTFVKNLQEVLHRLAEVNLLLNYDKCQIGMREVKYLGFIVNSHGRRIDPDRIQNLRDMKGPSRVKGVQKLVGSINFLRQFIPDYSRMAEPIPRLLSSKSKEIVWGSEQKETWETILESLEKRLTISHIQEEGELILRTDASTFGIGGVLLQKQEDREGLINLFSRKFTKTEQRWTTIEQEAKEVYRRDRSP
ncbi:enzymatic polyprotein endonuclease reverse, partial [Aduncisulcus paluster]